jgi:hypothetical protein
MQDRRAAAGAGRRVAHLSVSANCRHNPRTMGGFNSVWRAIAVLSAVSTFAFARVCSAADTSNATAAALESTGAHADTAGRLQIDVHFDCSLAPPSTALAAAGLAVASSVKSGAFCVVEGWAPPTALPQIRVVPGVTRITAPSYVMPAPPRSQLPVAHQLTRGPLERQSTTPQTIDQNGVSIMRAGPFVSQTGVNGAGVTVGVQSSGVYSLSTIESRGELPTSVQVVYPAGATGSVQADEGTVLLEEVHAVAPGAKLVYCGPSTFVDFTSCLTQLVNAGATIVLDDTGMISDGLMSQNSDQTSAVVQFLTQNPTVMMFSSAGNNDGTYWEGDYVPVTTTGTSLPALACPANSATPDAYVATFGGATSQTLTVIGSAGASFPLLLAWADPPGQITSRFDVYWFAAGGTTPLGCFSTSGSTTDQAMQELTLAAGTYTVVVASPDASASGKYLKLWAGGDGLTTLSIATPGGLITPQAMAPGALMIGAVDGADGVGNTIEPFSSSGPLTFQFPTVGQLLAPTLVAPDGITVDATGTYFESELFPDGNFYGTSAAVPNAAAVAALLRSAFPALSVAQLSTALQSGATTLGTGVPNDVFGYGRVDALGALATLPSPTMSALVAQSSTGSASTTAQTFTVTGTGPLHFTVSSSNTALVPSSVVSAGTPGVTISSGCGSTTLSCTVSITPVTGQAGTATVTISVLDGANRPATAPVAFTATNPAPATTSTTSNGGASSGGHGGGGALQYWVLLCLGALLALRPSRDPRRGAVRSNYRSRH